MKDEIFFQKLGQRLATFRREAGLSQYQLAELLNLKQQTWATYESATRRLPSSLILPLCQILNISSEQLLGAKKAKAKRGPVPKLQKQFQEIHSLSKSRQDQIAHVIGALLAQEEASAS